MFFRTPACVNFFPSIGNVFTNESFILVIGERFSLWWKRLLYLRVFFLLAGIITDLSENQFFRYKTLSLVETDFLSSGNYFLLFSQTLFMEFSNPKEEVLFFIQSILSC